MKKFDLYISTEKHMLYRNVFYNYVVLVRNNNMKRYSILYTHNLIKDLFDKNKIKEIIKESKIYSSTTVKLPESYELLSFNSVDEAIKIIEDSPEIFL